MKDRLTKIITAEGLTPTLLADELGVQRSGISHILSGRNYPSFDFMQKLLTRFPKLNAEWFILGQGAMYKSTDKELPNLFAKPEPTEPIQTPIIPTPPEPLKPQTSNLKPQPLNESEQLSSAEDDQKNMPATLSKILPPAETNKTIEKIIILYADKTFAAYLQE